MIERTPYNVCETCREIVLQGYTDSIDDTDEHLSAVNRIDRILGPREYWMEQHDTHHDRFGQCELCQTNGDINFTVYSAK